MPNSIINSDNGVSSGSTGLKTTGGDNGILEIQTNGVTAITIDGSQNVSIVKGAALTNGTRQAVTSSASTTINVASGNVVDLTMAASITTLAFSNVPSSGTPVQLVIIFRNAADGTAYNVTWPASIYWNSNSASGSLVGPTLAAGANTLNIISLLTTDGGTKWRGWVEAVIPGQATGPALYSWGANLKGQLGVADGVNRSSPTQVGTAVNWAVISNGPAFSFGVKSDGTLWSWGYNQIGQLGQNNTIDRNSPVQIGSDTNWSKVAGGGSFALAIKTTGTLWSWGNGFLGALGSNNTLTRSSPVQVGALTDWAKIAAGNNFSMAIKTNGTLWTWGSNDYGQLGQNIASTVNRSSPVQVGALTDWAELPANSCNATNVVAVKTGGTLWSWGSNFSGQLGINNRDNRSSPVQVGAINTWSKVSIGRYHTLATRTNGTLWSWGNNFFGQLGLSDANDRSSPVQVGAQTDWSKVGTAFRTSFAIKTTGSLWSWGSDETGTLGQNTLSNTNSPNQIGSSTSWQDVSGGQFFATSIFNQPEINPA
jgi:alpha-tubulin suppressor-like RCC1 family protein